MVKVIERCKELRTECDKCFSILEYLPVFRRKVSLKTKASALFCILLFVAIVIASVVSLIVATVTTASVVLSFIPNVIFSYLVGITAGIVFGILIFYFLTFVMGLILMAMGK